MAGRLWLAGPSSGKMRNECKRLWGQSAVSLCMAENLLEYNLLIFTDEDYLYVFWTWFCSVPWYRKLHFIRDESSTM